MAYSGTTTHYGLPKYVSTDKPSWLDTNDGFDAIDTALYAASQAVDPTQIAQMQNDITALQTGKQNVLTFDATPTNGSVNPVTSGGVFTALNSGRLIAQNTDTTATWATRLSSLKSAYDSLSDDEKLRCKFIEETSTMSLEGHLSDTRGVFILQTMSGSHLYTYQMNLAGSNFSCDIIDGGSASFTDNSSTVPTTITSIKIVVM